MTNMVHTLASKVLHTPLFILMEWSSFGIQPSKACYLAGRILEGKAPPSSFAMAQNTADLPTTEDLEETARPQARFAVEAIVYFDAQASDGQEPTSSYDSPAYAGEAYL